LIPIADFFNHSNCPEATTFYQVHGKFEQHLEKPSAYIQKSKKFDLSLMGI
jgi:hypothetical protein